jgi:hypothetical protein
MALAALWAVCGGCRSWSVKPVPVTDPTPAISEPITRAEVRRDAAVAQIDMALPKISGEPKTHIEVGRATLQQQRKDLQDARQGVADVQADRNHMADAYNDATKQLGHLRGQWYVKAGIWIERSLWTIAIGWIVMNLVAFAGGLGSPVGWFAWLAKQIRLFMPAMNLASWLLAWKGKK